MNLEMAGGRINVGSRSWLTLSGLYVVGSINERVNTCCLLIEETTVPATPNDWDEIAGTQVPNGFRLGVSTGQGYTICISRF